MENLPMNFKIWVIGIVLLMIIWAIFLGVFEFKIRRLHKRLVRERLHRFVQFPWLAITSYFEGCDFETWLKVRPDMWIDYYVDTSRKLSGDGLSMATAFKNPLPISGRHYGPWDHDG